MVLEGAQWQRQSVMTCMLCRGQYNLYRSLRGEILKKSRLFCCFASSFDCCDCCQVLFVSAFDFIICFAFSFSCWLYTIFILHCVSLWFYNLFCLLLFAPNKQLFIVSCSTFHFSKLVRSLVEHASQYKIVIHFGCIHVYLLGVT